jgi:hypothetical protein
MKGKRPRQHERTPREPRTNYSKRYRHDAEMKKNKGPEIVLRCDRRTRPRSDSPTNFDAAFAKTSKGPAGQSSIT